LSTLTDPVLNALTIETKLLFAAHGTGIVKSHTLDEAAARSASLICYYN
jgi:hypothetical protein